MNYKNLTPLIITALWISCANKADNKNPVHKDSPSVQTKIYEPIKDSNVYDDIDLFKLKGIGEIKHPTSYPYIKIESQNDTKKRIVYKYSAADSSERIYEKKEAYWLGYYEFRPDSAYHRTYQYVESNKITELSYRGSQMKTGFHLDDINIIEKNKNTMYSYWGKIGSFIEPTLNNLDLIKNKVNVVVTEDFIRKNGILTIYSKSFDNIKKQFFAKDTNCYDIGEHSWFWFEKFGWSKKVECN